MKSLVCLIGLVLFSQLAQAEKTHEGSRKSGRASSEERTAAEALLTDPLGNIGSASIVFDADVLFTNKTAVYSIDIKDLEKVGADEYTAKARVSYIFPGAYETIRLKRNPILPNQWTFTIGRFNVALPFVGPVLTKPTVISGPVLLGSTQKVKNYWTLPKFSKKK